MYLKIFSELTFTFTFAICYRQSQRRLHKGGNGARCTMAKSLSLIHI